MSQYLRDSLEFWLPPALALAQQDYAAFGCTARLVALLDEIAQRAEVASWICDYETAEGR